MILFYGVKAPAIERSKLTPYYNMRSISIAQPRGFDTVKKHHLFLPGSLDKGSKGQGNSNSKHKTSIIPITGAKKIKHEEIVIIPPNIPEGSRFKGYSDFHVEELNIEALKIKYRLAVYETPRGEILRGRFSF